MHRTHASRVLNLGGLSLLGGALLSADAAWLHMRALLNTYGVICGAGFGASAHCPACYASAALFAMGGACLLLARDAGPVASATIAARR